MHDINKHKEAERDLTDFLKGNKNTKGKSLFDRWASSLLNEKKNVIIPDALGESLKSGISSKINNLSPKSQFKTKSPGYIFMKIAASVVIFLVISFSVYKIIDKNRTSIAQVIVVPNGHKQKVLLEDGTTVHLNSGSKLTCPQKFIGNTRRITLSGEAFFEVARNVKKPFIIESGKIITTVLGTSFNVQAYPNEDIKVTVATGKVKVVSLNKSDKQSGSVFLEPGQQAVYSLKQAHLIQQQVSVNQFIDWQNNTLYFEYETLASVFKKLERVYGVHIHCDNKTTLQQTVKTSFRDDDIKTVMNDLQFILDFKYHFRTKDTIEVTNN